MGKKTPIINFADEVRKRTGVELDVARIAKSTQRAHRRTVVTPEEDDVVKLAIDILSLVHEKIDLNPVGVIAALQLVGNTLSEELVVLHGRDRAAKMVVTAHTVSAQYKPRYKGKSNDDEHGGSNGEVERNPEDLTER